MGKIAMSHGKVIILVAIISVILFSGCVGQELQLTPSEREGRGAGEITGTEVGVGWSVKNNPQDAVKEAVDMALEGKINKKPEFTIVFAASGSDLKAILLKARELLGEQVNIYGGTSAIGVMTHKGYVKMEEKAYTGIEDRHALVLMTITSEEIDFGVGSANYSAYPSLKEASKAALLKAIENAGKPQDEIPSAILMTPTIGNEDEAIAGIEAVFGKDTPVLGGTAGGPTIQVFGVNEIYDQGISLAVMYTDLPVGIIFEGGFDITGERSGVVTKVDGQGIVEINNRPALDVYNEWMDGEIDRLYAEIGDPGTIRDMLTLHPLYREYTTSGGRTYRLFSHPWPKDDTLVDRTVMTSTNVKVGDKVYLSHGTWETLLNRIGNSPRKAKERGNLDADTRPLFGIGYICGGVMGVIPEVEREKMPMLINYENNNAPFIAAFTWGEQGYYPGLGNRHGNLQSGFLVVGPEKQ